MATRRISRRHNGGPPLDDERHTPPWGRGGFGTYFAWKRAHRAAWRSQPWDVARFRSDKAEALGLTDEEYTLEILERGRYLQAEDTDRIAAIKARRRKAFSGGRGS
jgi:hypothetical protein